MNSCGCIQISVDNTVPLEDLMRFVATVIPTVPYEVGIEYLRQAYITFATKTRLLAYRQEITLQRDVHEYELQAPEGYEVFGILQQSPRDWGYVQLPNVNRWFTYYGERVRLEGNTRIILENAPSVDNKGFHVDLHLLPNECVNDIPREINTPYGRGIAKGALAELLMMPGKSWSSPRTADKYERDFHIACQSGLNLYLTNRGAHKVMMDPVRVL